MRGAFKFLRAEQPPPASFVTTNNRLCRPPPPAAAQAAPNPAVPAPFVEPLDVPAPATEPEVIFIVTLSLLPLWSRVSVPCDWVFLLAQFLYYFKPLLHLLEFLSSCGVFSRFPHVFCFLASLRLIVSLFIIMFVSFCFPFPYPFYLGLFI